MVVNLFLTFMVQKLNIQEMTNYNILENFEIKLTFINRIMLYGPTFKSYTGINPKSQIFNYLQHMKLQL